jgi:hypothetical protein
MQAITGSKLLDLWERGFGLHSLDRSLLALSAALPEVPPESFSDWPLGRRNRALVELHCCCFGSRLEAWASCARCGEKMEFDLDGDSLLNGAHDSPEDGMVHVNGRSFRVPTSRDLACIAREFGEERAVVALIEHCRVNGEQSSPLSGDELQAVEDAMELADPAAELSVTLCCPACSDEWNEALDLVSFLWAEIEARARQLLWEVHSLASAYGWTQGEILAVSEARRALYLEMVRA